MKQAKLAALLTSLSLSAHSAMAQAPEDALSPSPPPPPAPAPSPSLPLPLAPAPLTSPFRFALQAEPQIGVSGGKFFNQLVTARFDYRFTPTLSFGPSLSYANLKGKDGRTSNALASLVLEYRPSIGASAWGVPLRFAPGYLPQNGPVLRLSAGIAYALGPHVDVVLDAFTPTFLVIKNGTVVSLGGALELSYAP
jgi:hypothetical protein